MIHYHGIKENIQPVAIKKSGDHIYARFYYIRPY